jgi:hypothetical protein
MLRSFALTLVLGTTIVVQCGEQVPPSPDAKPTQVTQPRQSSTPTKTAIVKDVAKASPATKSPKPSATATPETSGKNLPDCVQKDCNCGDFAQQKEAQAVLEAFPDDPHKLDKNQDGVACESLP